MRMGEIHYLNIISKITMPQPWSCSSSSSQNAHCRLYEYEKGSYNNIHTHNTQSFHPRNI